MQPAPQLKTSTDPPQTCPSLLLLESDDAVRESLELMLVFSAFDTLPVSNSTEALEAIAANPFDLVLLDCALAETNGIDVIFEIRARFPNLRIVAMSADVDNEALALAAGAARFVPKPIEPAQLLEALQSSRQTTWRGENEPGVNGNLGSRL